MNKKLIAAAVSAAVVAPVAAYGEASFYGRINNAIDINDLSDADGADSTTDVSGVASRFGFKYSGDIGNGLTAHGRYEFSTTSDKEGSGVGDTRIATAGLSGGFGRVDVGNQWSSYFNTFGTLVSPTYSLGYYIYSSVGGAPFRASNTIKYSNSFGPVSLQLDVRLNGSNETGATAEKLAGDGIGLGLSFAVSDNITIAAAFDNEEGLDGAAAVAASVGTPTVPESDDYDPGTPPTVGDDGVVAPGTPQVGTAEVTGTPPTAAKAAGPDLPDTDRVGIGIKASFGGISAALGWQNLSIDDNGVDADGNDIKYNRAGKDTDRDSVFLNVSGNFGEKTGWLVSYSQADTGGALVTTTGADKIEDTNDDVTYKTDDATQLLWGVYHNLGSGLRLYYEATSFDDGLEGGNDGDRHLLGMRVDF